MPRIRSVHPGQWRDGDFLDLSPLARLLCLALRNLADDRGAFRWKPKTIKAECLPCDNCEIEDLLTELVANEQLEMYALGGKRYGLIRDFTQWQRPKSPKSIHPIAETLRKSHGLKEAECDTVSETVPNKDGNDTEISPQREEGGGNREEVKKDNPNGLSKEKPKTGNQEIQEILESVLTAQTAKDVIEHRKKMKKPLTARAAQGLIKKYVRARDGPEAAAEAQIVNGWVGFDANWTDKNGIRNSKSGRQETAGVVGTVRRLQAEAQNAGHSRREPDIDPKRLEK